MLQLLEIIPLIVFVAVYNLDGHTLDLAGISLPLGGIYHATAALMAATTLQVAIVLAWKHRIEKRLLCMWLLVIVFGAATLLLHNPLFLFWKPTVFNWGLCLLLLGSHWLGRDNLVQTMLGNQLALPAAVSTRLCFIWAGYFFLVGALNLVVAFNFSEAFWVKYKLWSALGFTVIMVTITALVLAPFIRDLPDPPVEP